MNIAIVVPAYNASRFLAMTLDSVLSQTFVEWELIVVDDGSTDDTAAVALEYVARDKRVRLVRQANGGVAQARNHGFAEVSTEYDAVAFLDHDDVWHTEALSLLSLSLLSDPAVVAAHGMAQKVDASGRPFVGRDNGVQNYTRQKWVNGRALACSREEPTTTAQIILDNWICTPGLALMRMTALQTLVSGGALLFDTEAVPLDDWDFWLRLSFQGDLAFVDEVILNWRRHAAAGSQDVSAMEQAEWRLRDKFRRMPELNTRLHTIADVQFRRLEATRERRDARRLWAAARAGFARGQVDTAVGQAKQALAHYAQYIRRRRHGGEQQ